MFICIYFIISSTYIKKKVYKIPTKTIRTHAEPYLRRSIGGYFPRWLFMRGWLFFLYTKCFYIALHFYYNIACFFDAQERLIPKYNSEHMYSPLE